MKPEQDRINFLIAIKKARGDLRNQLIKFYEARYSKPVELYEVKEK